LDQLVTIEILGQPFTFKTDSDVAEAREMADFVSKSVHKAADQFAGKQQHTDNRAVLVLAALNIANEYFDLKKQYQRILNDLGQRSEQLLYSLDFQDVEAR
jgi:cell division protein ZapA